MAMGKTLIKRRIVGLLATRDLTHAELVEATKNSPESVMEALDDLYKDKKVISSYAMPAQFVYDGKKRGVVYYALSSRGRTEPKKPLGMIERFKRLFA